MEGVARGHQLVQSKSLSLAACRLVESLDEANKLMPRLHLITAAQPASTITVTVSAPLVSISPLESHNHQADRKLSERLSR